MLSILKYGEHEMKLYLFNDINNFDYSKHLDCLPEERRKKALNYKQEIDRKLCVASYILLKNALKGSYGIDSSINLRYSEHGKPYLTDYENIFFNISHCKYGVVCAVSDYEIGVDIQDIRPFKENVPKKVFCIEEQELLDKATDKNREFARIWSKKEAYFKMLGSGLTRKMNEFNTLDKNYIQTFDYEDFCISVSCLEDKNICIFKNSH